MLYITLFLFSGCFIYLSSKFDFVNDRIWKYTFAFLAIFILSFAAGIRDYSIGTDTVIYKSFFDYVPSAKNIIEYCLTLHRQDELEYGFSIFNYLIGITGVSAHIFNFCSQFLIASNIYVALAMMKKHINITLGWLTYCFMFFPITLNINRQCIALSFVLVSVALIYNSHYLASIIVIGIAFCFHVSSIFACIIYLAGLLIKKAKSSIQLIYVILFLTVIVLMLPQIVNIMNSLGLIGSKFSQYLGKTTYTSLLSTMGIRIPMLLAMFYSFWGENILKKRNLLFIDLIIIFEFIILPFQNISPTVGRLLLYFGIVKVIGYPLIIKQLKNKNPYFGWLFNCLFIIFLIGIFYTQIIVNNNNQIYPFIIASDI